MSQGHASPSSGSITALLRDDHRRLDAIFSEVKESAGAAGAGAAARFAEFRAGLERHIDAEEHVLFPAFEAATGTHGAGPTAVMRSEHAEIRRLMDEIAAALEREGADRVTPLAALTARLAAHNGKEERILYPMSDDLAAAGELRAAIAERLGAAGA